MNEIAFMIPEEFIKKVASNEVIRYGTILKDANTGKIVGHLKEVGNLSTKLGMNIPFNPLDTASNISSNIQLAQIQNTLSQLQLITSIGAVASVATLGVSIVGFSLVLNKIKKLDEKMNDIQSQNEQMLQILEEMKIKQEVFELSILETAQNNIDKALITNSSHRRDELLKEANNTFTQYKNYYYNLVKRLNLWNNQKLSIEMMNSLYNKYIGCLIGEIYTEFLLGETDTYYHTLNQNIQKVSQISNFDAQLLFNNLSNNYSHLDFQTLVKKIKNTKLITIENLRRIETMDTEMKYLENKGIEPIEYIKYLKKQPDNIVLIPAS